MYEMPFVSRAVRVDHEDGWVVAFNLGNRFAADKGNERKKVYLSTPKQRDKFGNISWISTPEQKEQKESMFSRIKSNVFGSTQTTSGGKRKSSKKKRTRKSKRNKKSKTRRRR